MVNNSTKYQQNKENQQPSLTLTHWRNKYYMTLEPRS
jgi:hypothetical protein